MKLLYYLTDGFRVDDGQFIGSVFLNMFLGLEFGLVGDARDGGDAGGTMLVFQPLNEDLHV